MTLNRRDLGRAAIGALGLAAIGGCTADRAGSPASPTAPAPGRSEPRPEVEATLVTRWDVDPWARGSYSALPVGTTWRARAVLRDALIDGRLALAGEFTATDFPATTHGAYGSGLRAAEALLAAQPGARTAVVVGAGIAGLAAAGRLRRRGLDVVVLEARQRVGGRISTDRSWGVPLELGASWVHALDGNPLVPLARRAGLTLVPTDFDDAAISSARTGRRPPTGWASVNGLWRAVDRASRSQPPVDATVAEALAAAGWSPVGPTGRAAEVTELVQEYGLDLDVLGAQALWEGNAYRGGDAMVRGGYDAIPAVLASGLDVRLDTAVRRVRVDVGQGGGAKGSPGQIEALTDAGAVAADVAVVAVPLPLLQAGLPALDLPTAVRAAAEGLSTGNLEKVFVRYDRPWWPDRELLQVVASPGDRWAEWYDLRALTDDAVLVGFSGGRAALARPADDDACAMEAVAVLAAGYSGWNR